MGDSLSASYTVIGAELGRKGVVNWVVNKGLIQASDDSRLD